MNRNYESTEKEITTIQAHDKNCIGCDRHGKYVMISYESTQDDEIIDLFLTQSQAKYLSERLLMCINDNLK